LYSDRVSKEKQFEYKQFLEEMKQKQEQASQINNPEIKNSDSMPVNKP
ncbi:MAG TPA: hypothetical protein HA350_05265, partial [Candidatus Nitrosotenuis sp.]|nr:hypothetical protein [Candidatus Nitrosotenuis sp.]